MEVLAKIGCGVTPEMRKELKAIVEDFAREVRSHVDERLDELIVNLGYRGLNGTDCDPGQDGDEDDAGHGHRHGESERASDTPAQSAAKRLLGEYEKD